MPSGAPARHEGFDRLSPNGSPAEIPFALSLSKGLATKRRGFDKLSPNGFWR